jgi:hypothetical protein
MGVRALVPVGESRWMAPKDVRLIPTLYKRGSKNGLIRLSGALQTYACGGLGASSGGRKRILLAAILPLRSIPRS